MVQYKVIKPLLLLFVVCGATFLHGRVNAQPANDPFSSLDSGVRPAIAANEELPELDNSIASFEEDREQFTGFNYESLPWKGTMMFGNETVKQVYETLTIYRPPDIATPGFPGTPGIPGSPIGAPDPGCQGIACLIPQPPSDPGTVAGVDGGGAPPSQPDAPTVAPAFYLNSLLFYNQENWTIWVNNRRVRKSSKLKKVEVTNISQDAVEFIWRPENLELISPNWRTKLNQIADESFPEGEDIPIDDEAGFEEITNIDEGINVEEDINFPDVNIDNIDTSIPVDDTIPDINATINDTAQPTDSTSPNVNDIEETELALEEEVPLDLPPLYEQEEFSIDIAKLSDTLINEWETVEENERARRLAELRRDERLLDGVLDETGEIIEYIWEYSSDDGSILVDSISNVVKFKLGVNQTFVSRNMQIVEGFVESETITAASQETEQLGTTDLENVLFESGDLAIP